MPFRIEIVLQFIKPYFFGTFFPCQEVVIIIGKALLRNLHFLQFISFPNCISIYCKAYKEIRQRKYQKQRRITNIHQCSEKNSINIRKQAVTNLFQISADTLYPTLHKIIFFHKCSIKKLYLLCIIENLHEHYLKNLIHMKSKVVASKNSQKASPNLPYKICQKIQDNTNSKTRFYYFV